MSLPHWLVHKFTMVLNNNEHCSQLPCTAACKLYSKNMFNVEKFPG